MDFRLAWLKMASCNPNEEFLNRQQIIGGMVSHYADYELTSFLHLINSCCYHLWSYRQEYVTAATICGHRAIARSLAAGHGWWVKVNIIRITVFCTIHSLFFCLALNAFIALTYKSSCTDNSKLTLIFLTWFYSRPEDKIYDIQRNNGALHHRFHRLFYPKWILQPPVRPDTSNCDAMHRYNAEAACCEIVQYKGRRAMRGVHDRLLLLLLLTSSK